MLTLPTAAGGRRDRISLSRGLDAELPRCERHGGTLSEYFAPSYVEVRKVDGKLVNMKRPLLSSYAFIRSSVEEILRMKQTLPLYNFLPRVSPGGIPHFPYLSGSEMGNLRWVAESYSNEFPMHVPDSSRLLKGDRVRTTLGHLAGMEAEVVIQSGGGYRDVMARTLDCTWVPLLEAKPGGCELVELNINGKHVYIHLDNNRLRDGLHDALGRYHTSGSVGEEDTRLTCKVLRAYGSLCTETNVMHCKVYSSLLSAYKLLGEKGESARLLAMMHGMLLAVKAPQSRALLLVMLYGCTDSSLYRQMAHEVVNSWRSESSPKKSKLLLIRRLDDYNRWLNHKISQQ